MIFLSAFDNKILIYPDWMLEKEYISPDFEILGLNQIPEAKMVKR